MNALPLLLELAGRGVHIRADSHHLVVSQDKLTGSLDTRIRDNKSVLIRSLERLRQYADSDAEWQQIVEHPDQLKNLIYSVITPETRAHGDIPASYTDTVYCQTCKQSVPHFPVGVTEVGCCVWCLTGQPVLVTGDTQ